MKDASFFENVLELGSQQVVFNKKVEEVIKIKGLYAVLLKADEELNNVYAVDQSAQIAWRVKSPSKDIAGVTRQPYVFMSVINQELGFVDFTGRRYTIDIQDGSITEVEIVK